MMSSLGAPPCSFMNDIKMHNGLGGYPCLRKVEKGGREYNRRCRNMARGRTLSHISCDGEEAKRSMRAAEEALFKRYQTSIKGKDFLSLTMYEQLGIDDIGFEATVEQIKKAYHRVLIEHHPDKTGKTENDPNYLAVQKAFNTLVDPTKRRAYDSTCDFDESIPTGSESIKQHGLKQVGGNGICTGVCFYDLYGPVFERNARFSKVLPVPFFGDETTDVNDVFAFYDFYLKFDSWRDFSHDSEHDAENAQHRNEKRFLQKKNEVASKKKKKKEYARLADLVDRAMAADPRLRRQKHEDKMAKIRSKQEKEDKVQAVAMALKEKEDQALQMIADKEAVKSEKSKSQKLEKDKAKKVLRKVLY